MGSLNRKNDTIDDVAHHNLLPVANLAESIGRRNERTSPLGCGVLGGDKEDHRKIGAEVDTRGLNNRVSTKRQSIMATGSPC